MKKSIKKLILSTVMTVSMLSVSVFPASAEWKSNNIGWWNTEGSSYSIGWKQIDSKWYYFNTDGYMKADSWLQDGSKWYFLKPDGAMAINETYKGCKFDTTGVWNQNITVDSNNTTNANTSVSNTENSNNSSNTVNNVDNSTSNNSSLTLNNTGVINANTTNNVTVDNTSKEEKNYYENKDTALKLYYKEQLRQAKEELNDSKQKLETVKSQNTVKVAQQQADGTYKYVGQPDQEKINQAEKEVKRCEGNVEYYEKLAK